MFDKYLIVADSLRNTGPADAPDGFAFEAKLGYYRGLALSMVEAMDISIDGEVIDASAVRIDEGGGPLTFAEMATAFDRRWGFGASAMILVSRPGGLPAGEHEVAVSQRLRVSYLPFPAINTDKKTMRVAA